MILFLRVSRSLSHSSDTPISALQHWIYCPRQFALIHIDRIWVENQFTAEGRVLHERVDNDKADKHKGIKTIRSVELSSLEYSLYGVADVVEMHNGLPYPVEYKRGRPKSHPADKVQLCAQALCLEEMFACGVTEGALYYGKVRRRTIVKFDNELRNTTLKTIEAIRQCKSSGRLPPAIYEPKRCDRCSLSSLCQPRLAARSRSVSSWMDHNLRYQGVPE